MNPIERLQLFFRVHHSHLNIHDVRLSAKPGYLEITATKQLLCIQGVSYGRRDPNGKYVSINQLWTDLHDYYNAHVDVSKEKSGLVTAIVWDGKRYIFDHKNEGKNEHHGRKVKVRKM